MRKEPGTFESSKVPENCRGEKKNKATTAMILKPSELCKHGPKLPFRNPFLVEEDFAINRGIFWKNLEGDDVSLVDDVFFFREFLREPQRVLIRCVLLPILAFNVDFAKKELGICLDLQSDVALQKPKSLNIESCVARHAVYRVTCIFFHTCR